MQCIWLGGKVTITHRTSIRNKELCTDRQPDRLTHGQIGRQKHCCWVIIYDMNAFRTCHVIYEKYGMSYLKQDHVFMTQIQIINEIPDKMTKKARVCCNSCNSFYTSVYGLFTGRYRQMARKRFTTDNKATVQILGRLC